jgi:hypothetical protein
MPFVRLAFVRYQPNALDGAKISKVVLGDFAQVLPRRRSTFKRTAAQLTFALHGTVPDHGPMLFPADSPYLDMSPIPLPGTTVETGRNKIELVLQTRDPALDTDLAWSDVQVLASSLLTPASTVIGPVLPGGVVTPTVRPTVPAKAAAASRRKGTERAARTCGGQSWRCRHDREATIGTPPLRGCRDAARSTIWQTTITLPAASGKPARPRRPRIRAALYRPLDREARAGQTHQRRVVEERLVYTAFFNL